MTGLQSALAGAARPRFAPPPPPETTYKPPSLRDYQDDFVAKVREALKGARAVLLVAATGAGKCLARGTPVMMFDGTIKAVENVAVGDLLMGPDSKPRSVVSLARGREMMYRITPTKGDPYTVNESHILSLRNKHGEVINASILELSELLPYVGHRGFMGWRVPGVLRGDLTPDLVPITISKLEEDDYFGFEIAGPDRLFLLGDFTVTHNTVVFSYIARQASNKGKRVLILAHRDQLIKQASKKLTENGVQHGIIMAGFTPYPRRAVQVASVQTLVRRLEKMKAAEKAAGDAARAAALAAGATEAAAEIAAVAAEKALGFDLIVIDEAHLSAAASYMKVLDAWPKAKVLGVTGSPIRLDGKGLGRHCGGAFDVLVQGISIKQLINRGYLCKPKYFGSREKVDLSGVGKKGGDYDTDALASVMDKPKITGSAIAEYQKVCPGVPAVAWCANVAHAKHVAEQFNASGIPAVALSGEDDTAARDKALADLSSGKIKIITFAMLLVEGVDCPAIGAVILLRPTMSLSSYLQVIGRGLRPIYADGMPLSTVEDRFAAIDAGPKGRVCYVLDHCDLWKKHGMAHAEREWSLEGQVKKKGKKKEQQEEGDKLIQCKNCWHVFEPEEAIEAGEKNDADPQHKPCCPKCKHPVPARVRKLEHADGELTEITEEMAERERKSRQREVHAARTIEELQAIGAARGYSPTWARMVFEARKKKG